MKLITPEMSAAFYERKGLAAGELDTWDGIDRCPHCQEPTPADELVALDDQHVCVPCLIALTGDDPYAPDNARDLGSATTAVTLLVSLFGGLLFLLVLSLGQQAMCDVHDQGLRYCAGYSPTTNQETRP